MRHVTFLTVSMLVTACTVAPVTPASLPSLGPGPSLVDPADDEEAIGAQVFRPITRAQLLRSTGPGGVQPAYQMWDRPAVRPGFSRARQLESGNQVMQYTFRSPLPDAAGLIVASVRASELGPGADPQTGHAALRQAWAGDGALVTAYVNLGGGRYPSLSTDPAATKDEASILKNAGWPLAYVSSAKREALYVYGDGLIVKVRWQAPNLTERDVPITADAAIARYDAAMRDASSRSKEEQTGLDHFLGFPYADAYPPSAWYSGNVHDDDAPAADFPKDTPWKAEFRYEYAGKPVWQVGVPSGFGFGGGMVDARTGEVVRFVRVTRRWTTTPSMPSPPLPLPSLP